MTSFNELDAKIKKFKKDTLQEEAPADMPVEVKNPAFQLAIELAASLALGVVLGVAADKYFGTKPLFILTGIVLGVAAGAWNFYRILKGAGLIGLPPDKVVDQNSEQ